MCGYCGRPLTLQPEGDWACSPCRELMAKIIVGPPVRPGASIRAEAAACDRLVDQWGRFCREAHRGGVARARHSGGVDQPVRQGSLW